MASIYVYVEPTGTIVPDAAQIQIDVENEYKNAFGQDLNVSPSTPQGVLITTEVLARIAVAENNVAVANQINPNLAGGVFLDAILALTGSARTPNTFTTVIGSLAGVVGTVVPAGSLAQNAVTGVNYATLTEVTIPSDVVFQAQEPGPTPCSVGDLSLVISNVLGWETVTNSLNQTELGQLEQSDASARTFRNNTLALQGTGTTEAITSGLYAVKDVKSLSFLENVTGGTLVIEGVTMLSHSIYICIDGGTDDDVANAILATKSAGAGYNNGASAIPVTVTITDEFTGQEYDVEFDRPDVIDISVQVTVKANSPITNPEAAIKQAVVDYANGTLSDEPGFTVGTDISSFEIAGAINREFPLLFVQDVQTKKTSGGSFSSALIPIAVFEKGRTQASLVTVVQA